MKVRLAHTFNELGEKVFARTHGHRPSWIWRISLPLFRIADTLDPITYR